MFQNSQGVGNYPATNGSFLLLLKYRSTRGSCERAAVFSDLDNHCDVVLIEMIASHAKWFPGSG